MKGETEKWTIYWILKAWGAHPRIRLWRANRGVGWFARGEPARKTDPGAYPVNFGIDGQGDYTGIIHPEGRRLELETKRPQGGRQSDAQKKFEAMIVAMGGVYVLAPTQEDFDAAMTALGITR